MYLAIKNQIFNRHSLPLCVLKDVPLNCLKIVTDKRQNQLSEPIDWPLSHSRKWQFSLTGRGGLNRRY